MRLLFICESFPTSNKIDVTGGVETRDWYVATELAKRHQVTVITNARYNAPSTETMKSVKVIRVGQSVTAAGREHPFVRVNFVKACIEAIPKIDFELIQGSNIVTQVIAAYMGKKLERPAVALIPDIFIGSWVKNTNPLTGMIGEILEPWAIHQPWSKIISWSEATKAKLVKRGVDSNIIHVISGGIDLSSIEKVKREKQGTPTIVTAARLVSYKHVEIVIKAVSLLSKAHPKLKAYILGDGPEMKNLQKLAVDLNLDNKIKFMGQVDNFGKVIKLFKSAHLFCLPSEVEGFGLATLEAVAAGLPYVNFSIPATTEVTEGGRGGILVDTLTPKAFAEALDSLLRDQRLYNTKVREGRTFIRKYDWSECVRKTEKSFASVIRQTRV